MAAALLALTNATQAAATAAAAISAAVGQSVGLPQGPVVAPVPGPAPAPAAVAAPALGHGPGGLVRSTAPWAAGYLYDVIPPQDLVAIPSAVTGVRSAMSQKYNNQQNALAAFNSARATGALRVV
ncbi:hypothetical protein C8R43DRAFT_966152 [Mycena crocata]|nr:hypothetical protein C8R43DRAFT_966152 [Mycena crocata]